MEKNYFKHFGLAFFLLFSLVSYGQLPDFTLTVSATDESCTANGSLNFTASNTTVGATLIYRIYHLPDTVTPIAVTSLNTFTGLAAGDYRVIATQSLGNESNTQEQDATIVNVIVALNYSSATQKEICGNDGTITITGIAGNPVLYEIISGPVIRPLQPSNVFEDLPGGNYVVRVFDNCGEGVVGNLTVGSSPAGLAINNVSHTILDACDLLRGGFAMTNLPGHVIAYPLVTQLTLYPATGPPIIINETDADGSENLSSFSYTIPVITGGYTFQATVTDGCGNTYTQNGTVNAPLPIYFTTQVSVVNCDGVNLHLSWLYEIGPVTLNFVSAPAGFNPTVFNSQYPGPYENGFALFFNGDVLLPNGTYEIELIDSCGRTASVTVDVFYPPYQITINTMAGCGANEGSIKIVGYLFGGTIAAAEMIAAPPAFPHPLPYDLEDFIYDNNTDVTMAYLPEGDYVFRTEDFCGREAFASITVEGYSSQPPTVTITPSCSSFTLLFDHICNNDGSYLLQKYYPAIDAWGNPNFESAAGGVFVYRNHLHVFEYTGLFRIVKLIQSFPNAQFETISCPEVIYNFEFGGQSVITDIYSFACSDNVLDVIVVASGLGPLAYRITTKNGQPFALNNGTNPVFMGLEPAVYNFQVEDVCGNIVNSLYDISQPVAFVITPENLCPGQNASLSVPNFPFLNYQWWKDNDTSTVLSTSSVLQFPNLNTAADTGIYHVRIEYPNENSCIDVVLDFEISSDLDDTYAGVGMAVSYCGHQGVIDLFSLLSDNDPNGIWIDSSETGLLNGHLWNSDAAPSGQYYFIYHVEGFCMAVDETVVSIGIEPAPETPAVTVSQPMCAGGMLQLSATDISFGTYQWTGPNGFSSNEQNPVITNASSLNSGTYSVQAVTVGCDSGIATVDIVVNPMPQVILREECLSNQRTITAEVSGTDLSYSWTGPDNYSNTQNPIIITGKPVGTYSLAVTSPDGCVANASIAIANTLCDIPKGVSPNNDGNNDSFDLSGFDIDDIKIFNRYGMVVFEQQNYINEWNGQDFKGRQLPSATYYYLLHLQTGETKSGWVYLMQKD